MSPPSVGRHVPFLVVLFVLAAIASQVAAGDAVDPPGSVAVRVIVRTSEAPAADPTSREYRMTLTSGDRTKLVNGRRLPIPATSWNGPPSEEGGRVPATSYTYQTVGFQAILQATIQPDGRIRLVGGVEDSHVLRYRDGVPDIRTLEQSVDVLVRPGETVVLHRSDSGDRKVEIRLQADLTG